MIFAFLHATLGWLLAALAVWALRRRSPDARCWAWRLGLLKGPLALLLAVPVFYSPLPFGGEGSGVRGVLVAEATPSLIDRYTKPSPAEVRAENLPSGRDKSLFSEGSRARHPFLSRMVRAVRGRGRGIESESGLSASALVYTLGVSAVLLARFRPRRPHLAMPRVVGILRPRVVIPNGLSPEDTAIALAHETAHVRRRDPQWSFVADLVCAALWFAPPVWLCARAMRLESEAACDAAALQETGAAKAAYARLLLAFAGPAPALALGGPARRLARRIRMLERNPKPLPRLAAAALVSVGLATLLPWHAEARPIRQATPKREVPVTKKNDPDGLMRLILNIQIERARAEVRRLEGELRNVQEGRPRFDPKGYRLIQKRTRADVAAELALANAAQQVRMAKMDAVRQSQARAAHSLATARRVVQKAKEQMEIERAQRRGLDAQVGFTPSAAQYHDAARAQRGAAEAVQRVGRIVDPPAPLRHPAPTRIVTPSVPSRPSMEADEIIMAGGKTTLKGNAKLNGETLDTVPAASKLGEPVKVFVSPDSTVWKIYRTGVKPPYQYQVERVSKAATSVPAAIATKKP